MTAQPCLSVVMTVYNGERFLAEAVDGILGQSFSDFELIVVDDASQDRTRAILAAYGDRRLRVIASSRNIGPYRAANLGLRAARGQLVARHDADDVSLRERFERQVAVMQARPQLTLIGTSYHVISEDGKVLDTSILPGDDATIQRRLGKGNVFLHGTFMMRRAALERVGFYQEHFPVSQDYDLSLRLAELGEVAILPEPLYLFRFHSSSVSRQHRALQLACRQLAWSQAQDRRQGRAERPVPDNVLDVYPPEPERLFSDALGTAYLFYAAGRTDLASTMIERAQELGGRLHKEGADYREWILQRAHKLVEFRDLNTGVAFIRWAAPRLASASTSSTLREVWGRFFAEQAHRAYQSGKLDEAMANAWRALRTDRSWWRNRGLWSIMLCKLRRKVSLKEEQRPEARVIV